MRAIDFQTNTPRIMGTEMEHNNTLILPYDYVDTSPVRRLLPHIAEELGLPQYQESNAIFRLGQPGFWPSGDRLYLDVGNHIEFSTAEQTTAAGVVGREFTGNDLLFRGMQRALEEGQIKEGQLFKNVREGHEYWGYHENYLGLRSLDIREHYLQPLATHIIARQIFAGAGEVTPEGEFLISQKMPAARTLDDGSASNTMYRPIIDANRDEPHAYLDEWRRIHIAIGDAHLNPRSAWLQLITTSIVARLVEAEVDLSDLEIQSPVSSAHAVAKDTDLTVKLVVGQPDASRQLTALEVQKELLSRAAALNDRDPMPVEEQKGLEVWDMVLTAIEQRDESALEWVEWMDKKELVDQYIARSWQRTSGKARNLTLASEIIRSVNRQWANLDASSKTSFGLRRTRDVPEWVMSGYGDLTPPDGRAAIRGSLIAQFAEIQLHYESTGSFAWAADWSAVGAYMTHPKGGVVTHRILDPYGEEEFFSYRKSKDLASA